MCTLGKVSFYHDKKCKYAPMVACYDRRQDKRQKCALSCMLNVEEKMMTGLSREWKGRKI